MSWQDTHARLRECLRLELRKNWGSIAEIEERVSCSNGYLNKLSAGTHEFKLDLFLKTLDALEIDPRAFFSRALGIQPVPEDYLQELEDGTENDRALARIDRAIRRLESAPRPELADGDGLAPADRAVTAGAEHVADFVRCPVREQHRRLRDTRRYRTHAFARAYLEHLDTLRYENAAQAAKLAEKVATHLVPALPGPRRERGALQCAAIGIFASARRMKGRFATAARAFRMGLELARRTGNRAETAALLQRSSYLLKDFGHFERALDYLREALEIYVDLDCEAGLARTLIDRGMMLYYLGKYQTAVGVLEQALRRLDAGQIRDPRNRFAAYQCLAYAHVQLGDLEGAESQLAKATDVAGSDRGVYWGKLRWLQGSLALKRGAYRRAERLLRSASQALATQENSAQEALVSIDLVEALLAQGRLDEACELAAGMARFLGSLRNNRLAEMATFQLVRAGLDGTLSRRLLNSMRAQQREGRRPSVHGSKREASARNAKGS